MASLAFKIWNLIKVLVPSLEVPLATPSRIGLPLLRFKTRWSGIRERVRNFGESGSQRVDSPPIFHGDLTLKLLAKAKPSTSKRKGKTINVPAVKKPRVCTFLSYFILL